MFRPLLFSFLVGASVAKADVYHVSQDGNDKTGNGSNEKPWLKIQHALDECEGGDTVLLHKGTYAERISINGSGSKEKGWITLRGMDGAILSGKGLKGQTLIEIDNQSYVRLQHLELTENHHGKESTAILISGAGEHLEIKDCHISNCTGKSAVAIGIYGTDKETPLSQIVVDGCSIINCEPAPSEALTLNGNVTDFQVTNNRISDVNNIGIDFIGGEKDVMSDDTKVARKGICRGNQVARARSTYGDGFAAGIYVDGGADIIIENNTVTESDLGIEVGAENKGIISSGVVVRKNTIYNNDKAGLVIGGYAEDRGRVTGCHFIENTFYQNSSHEQAQAELWIQHASENIIRGNTFWVKAKRQMAAIDEGGKDNTVDGNTWYSDAGEDSLAFEWLGNGGKGFATWKSKSGWDEKSIFKKPTFTEPDKHIGVR